jgi:small conductance mechanosensitive channel
MIHWTLTAAGVLSAVQPSPAPSAPAGPSPLPTDLITPIDLKGDPTELRWWSDLISGPVLRTVLIIVGAFVIRFIMNKIISGAVRGWTAVRDTDTETPMPTLPAREVIGNDTLKAQRRAGRTATLGRLFSNVGSTVIATFAVLMIMAEWGFNVTPLLAGAGVIGVALGFGAQALVSDFLSGVFMLLEDQFGVGDIVEVNGKEGTVEDVHLRVTRMRSVNGVVYWIRNGEIKQLGNLSQNWSRSVLDISVAYDSNIPVVRRLMAEEAANLRADPLWQDLLIADAEVWGVEDLGSDGVVIRIVLSTLPGEQWRVARELRERIKARFDAEGVQIPFPQRVVWVRQEPAAKQQQ